MSQLFDLPEPWTAQNLAFLFIEKTLSGAQEHRRKARVIGGQIGQHFGKSGFILSEKSFRRLIWTHGFGRIFHKNLPFTLTCYA